MENKARFSHMSDDDRIMYVIGELQAKSPETAVSMEQIIEKAIEIGATEDYHTEGWEGYKEGDHPWWTKIAPMMGVGTKEMVAKHNVPHLHRKSIQKTKESTGNKTNVMVYWVDKTHRHKDEIRDNKKPVELPSVIKEFTAEEKQYKASNNPDKYLLVNGKLLSKEWARNHPEKFKKMYGFTVD